MSGVLEVCVDSFASVIAAREGGADRLEVCGPLGSGGTTPSYALVQRCVEEGGLPVMMMIRPHDGNFVYDDDDVSIMLREIEVARSLGVEGVVFGVLTPDGSVDADICQQLLRAAGNLQTTFHRAFDVASDPLNAFDTIQQLGFSRLLTSGQQATAMEGAPLIRELVQRTSVTQVLAGSGVSAANVRRLIDATGVSEVHASASRMMTADGEPGPVSFGTQRRVTDSSLVQAIKSEL